MSGPASQPDKQSGFWRWIPPWAQGVVVGALLTVGSHAAIIQFTREPPVQPVQPPAIEQPADPQVQQRAIERLEGMLQAHEQGHLGDEIEKVLDLVRQLDDPPDEVDECDLVEGINGLVEALDKLQQRDDDARQGA